MSGEANTTWLPNLVGGVSIWKLGVDLNEPKFMGGRLLVPETEGSESLPVSVRWDLTGLVPLAEARAKFPDDVAKATSDLRACLDRVAKVFATPNSGFDKYKDAFTVPAIDAEGGSNYFYSPASKKLFVINWGASPRSMGSKAEYVFGYQDWSKVLSGAPELTSAAAIPIAIAGNEARTAAAGAPDENAPGKGGDEPPKPPKKDDGKKRPWWIWPLFALIAIALLLIALIAMKSCEDAASKAGAGADASADALAEAASDDSGANGEAGANTDASANGDGGDASALGDGGNDSGADAASADGGPADAGKDAAAHGKDGGGDDDDDDDGPTGSSGGAGSSGGSSGGTVVVQAGPGGGSKTNVHRRHYQDGAVKWRVSAGNDRVSRTEDRGGRYDVWLGAGKTFEGVRVEWQDAQGKWHTH